MAIQFDIGAVKASAWEFGNVAGFTRSGVENIAKLLGDSSGMAGTDAPGQKFAKDYDALAKAAVELGATSVNGLSKAAQLLHATAVNHENADTQSALNNKALPAMPPPAAVTVTAPAILGPRRYGAAELVEHNQGSRWRCGLAKRRPRQAARRRQSLERDCERHERPWAPARPPGILQPG